MSRQMPVLLRQPGRVAVASAAVLTLIAVVIVLVAGSPGASAATTGQLRNRIAQGQSQISTLSGAVSSANQRVSHLGASIATLQSQVNALQAQLNGRRAALLKLQNQLIEARRRLAQLEATDTRDEGALAQQVVGSYESDQPDLVSVVLESTGFNNLLERLSFAKQIGKHDAQIVGQVKADRRAVATEASQLGAMSVRQQALARQILNQRNSVDADRVALISQQIAAARVRNARMGQLAGARQSLGSLQSQLTKLQAEQARQAAQSRPPAAPAPPPSSGSGSSGSGGGASSGGGGAPRSSSGGFVFPLPKSAASPPGTWSLDDGVDISAPGGTPEYAVCSGTVVLHGIGGFGPSAPVLRCDSPIDGYDYVYYGHAGPGNWTPVGTHVSAGQTISEIGYGIVGISTGPHVEMGFADSSGSPVGPSSAPTMMSLLRSSY
jgi:peptidoglycan hydrolase CwlO-like protein